MQMFSWNWAGLAALLCGLLNASAAEYKVVVSNGPQARRDSIVQVQLPAELRSAGYLEGGSGGKIPLQSDNEGNAWFVLPELAAGAKQIFHLRNGPKPDLSNRESIQVQREGRKLKITRGSRAILEYQAEPGELPRPDIPPIFSRGGYIHPIYSPSGKLITDDFPPNHIHHHGIWFAWTKTEFQGRTPDFWNMGQGKGRVEFVALDKSWSGTVHGGFIARHRYLDATAAEPVTALNETWEVRVYNAGQGERPYWVFDLICKQECATGDRLKLPQYHYGGLAVRGHWDWNGKGEASFLTSEGISDRLKANGTRGRWCHLGGEVDGELTGMAFLCHPENFRAPQPMRVHPDEPYFSYAPQQMGAFEIAPGTTYVSRYRFVVKDGAPDPKELDRLWDDYANPVEARLEKAR